MRDDGPFSPLLAADQSRPVGGPPSSSTDSPSLLKHLARGIEIGLCRVQMRWTICLIEECDFDVA